MTLLDVQRVHAGYGEMEILHEVSIEVREGEIVSLIGPNGAGKSTLIKTVFGLLVPTAGKVLFDGGEITGLKPNDLVSKGLSYVPQLENVFPSLTVQENLEMGAFLRRDDPRPRIEEIYRLFPILAERRREKVGRLSAGMRQMVAMGRALMLDPRLLLLDEPSAGLAPRLVELIFDKIVEINRNGVSVLIVEQRAEEILKLSHRGYILVDGQTRLGDTGEKLLQNEEVSRLFLGGGDSG